MKKITPIFLVAIFIIACTVTNKPDESKEDTAKQELVKQIINEDLNSRFVKFEIVEISKDSSNMKYVDSYLYSSLIPVAKANYNMTKEVANLTSYDEKSIKKCADKIQLIADSVLHTLHGIEMMQFAKEGSEPCYYVKYRVFKNEIKIEKEEIFYIDSQTEGKGDNAKVINIVKHYPYSWDEFLRGSKYDELKQKNKEGFESAVKLLFEL